MQNNIKKVSISLLVFLLVFVSSFTSVFAATNVGFHTLSVVYVENDVLQVDGVFYNVGSTTEAGIRDFEIEVRDAADNYVASTIFNNNNLQSITLDPGGYEIGNVRITDVEPNADLSRWSVDDRFVSTTTKSHSIEDGIVVFANRNQVIFSDSQPLIRDGRTLVPLRAVLESVGIDVAWDGETKTITTQKGEDTVVLQVGSSTAYVNGNETQLEVAPIIESGRTLIPLRFVSEAFGGMVFWGGDDKIVSIVLQ